MILFWRWYSIGWSLENADHFLNKQAEWERRNYFPWPYKVTEPKFKHKFWCQFSSLFTFPHCEDFYFTWNEVGFLLFPNVWLMALLYSPCKVTPKSIQRQRWTSTKVIWGSNKHENQNQCKSSQIMEYIKITGKPV